jgi:hypothetical protein
MGQDLNTRISKNMIYMSPGAGAVSLACSHGIRYPDICTLCDIPYHVVNESVGDILGFKRLDNKGEKEDECSDRS